MKVPIKVVLFFIEKEPTYDFEIGLFYAYVQSSSFQSSSFIKHENETKSFKHKLLCKNTTRIQVNQMATFWFMSFKSNSR